MLLLLSLNFYPSLLRWRIGDCLGAVARDLNSILSGEVFMKWDYSAGGRWARHLSFIIPAAIKEDEVEKCSSHWISWSVSVLQVLKAQEKYFWFVINLIIVLKVFLLLCDLDTLKNVKALDTLKNVKAYITLIPSCHQGGKVSGTTALRTWASVW